MQQQLFQDFGASGAVLKWAGSKAELSGKIIPLLASRQKIRLIEPFAGSAAIFFRLAPKYAILNDSNVNLMRFYSAIKRDVSRVADEITKISREAEALDPRKFEEYYYIKRKSFPDLKNMYKAAAEFTFLNKHCWNGLYREN